MCCIGITGMRVYIIIYDNVYLTNTLWKVAVKTTMKGMKMTEEAKNAANLGLSLIPRADQVE